MELYGGSGEVCERSAGTLFCGRYGISSKRSAGVTVDDKIFHNQRTVTGKKGTPVHRGLISCGTPTKARVGSYYQVGQPIRGQGLNGRFAKGKKE